ncbi:hypothetical protein GL4_2035 [Methyloceanibacter caenitepidi]|uniref:Uncharacterized protein n=1 Tax=Methyloceanibacter caenitepidi TaxID=1384459 RepID=A0A0A8K4L4_9HYPH|nr:hypothetical protein GL4_2035 [Methyloceanibacter caenitepidi]
MRLLFDEVGEIGGGEAVGLSLRALPYRDVADRAVAHVSAERLRRHAKTCAGFVEGSKIVWPFAARLRVALRPDDKRQRDKLVMSARALCSGGVFFRLFHVRRAPWPYLRFL